MYERLRQEAHQQGIDIYEKQLPKRLKGLYADSVIFINRSMDGAEKTCILAEELGHHHTTVGDITNQAIIAHRKQELRARQWAYERIVPLSKIVQAYRDRIAGNELAEYLGVTDEFLQSAIRRYRDKHGLYVTYEHYMICFDPLGVVERFE